MQLLLWRSVGFLSLYELNAFSIQKYLTIFIWFAFKESVWLWEYLSGPDRHVRTSIVSFSLWHGKVCIWGWQTFVTAEMQSKNPHNIKCITTVLKAMPSDETPAEQELALILQVCILSDRKYFCSHWSVMTKSLYLYSCASPDMQNSLQSKNAGLQDWFCGQCCKILWETSCSIFLIVSTLLITPF